MPHPAFPKERHVLKPLPPHRQPPVSNERRVRRMARRTQEEGAPVDPCFQERSAHVVDVVPITIVTGADGDDGLERWWLQGGNL